LRFEKERYFVNSNSKPKSTFKAYLKKSFYNAFYTLAIYFLSALPIVGSIVVPVISYYSFHQVVGGTVASTIFGVGFFIPKKTMILFLAAFYGGRSLVRELVGGIRKLADRISITNLL
jgi:hypothetical protein